MQAAPKAGESQRRPSGLARCGARGTDAEGRPWCASQAAELKFACDRMDELASVLNLPGIASELHALFGRELSERSERKAKGRGGGTTRQKEKVSSTG